MRAKIPVQAALLLALGCGGPSERDETAAPRGAGATSGNGPVAGAGGCLPGPCTAAGAAAGAESGVAGTNVAGTSTNGGGGSAGTGQPSGGDSGGGAGGGAGSGSNGGGGALDPEPAACVGDLGGYEGGSVTFYYLDQGTSVVHCSYGELGRNPDVIAHVATGAGQYFGAINTSDYAAAATCGACVEVTRDGGKSVTVTIVDECPIATNPKCTAGHIDLSREAFKQIGSESEGYLGTQNGGLVGQISWKYVPCPQSGNVHFTLKEPGNVNWNAVLVQGHRYPITGLQVNVEGNWVDAVRQDYNYWLPPNGHMGTSPYAVRVTDVNGTVLEASLALSGEDQDSGQQFSCE
jgi:expansin (peptidoglycan-binding protein)